jgi:hypothetical protein
MVAVAAGCDTWGPTWIVDPDSPPGRHLSTLAVAPSAHGGRRLAEKVAGHTVMWWEQHGLLKAEGHPLDGGLCPPARLRARLGELSLSLWEADVPVPWACRRFKGSGREAAGFAGFSRIDLTVDLSFPDGHGTAVLKAVEAAAKWSGLMSRPERGRAGDTQTVYTRSKSGVLARVYDKGLESLSHPAGHLIRPEAQWRWADRRRRPDEEDLGDPQACAAWMRERFRARFERWCRGRIVVGDMSQLADEIARAIEAGRLTPRQGEALFGYIGMRGRGGVPGQKKRTRQLRERQVRQFGFVLVDGVLEPVEVDLGAVLSEASRSDLWHAD